jgi:hypothetical protein
MFFSKNKVEKSVAATFYPAKILIVTMNQRAIQLHCGIDLMVV